MLLRLRAMWIMGLLKVLLKPIILPVMVRKAKYCQLYLLPGNMYIFRLMKMQEQQLLMHGVDIMEHW